MSYLPTSVEESTSSVVEEEKYKDYYYDEKENKIKGYVAVGIDALKSWIYFALKIARYRYPIYSWRYGSEIETLLGKQYSDSDYLLSETKRMIEDALLINPYIKEVSDVEINLENEKLEISCVVTTKYGDLYVKI